MKHWIYFLLATLLAQSAAAQLIYEKQKIYSPFTIEDEGAAKRRAQVVKHANDLYTLPIGKDDDKSFALDVALWNVSQFMVRTPLSDSGVARLVKNYYALGSGTQRSLLEVVYGQYEGRFLEQMKQIALLAEHPRTFAMAALHVYRSQPTQDTRQWILQAVRKLKPTEYQGLLAEVMVKWMDSRETAQLPPLDSLFDRQKIHGYKMIYSFQRANRDYPGLAIVQDSDGKFVRDTSGKLRTFVQLARSASNMPYFLTNGSTPQGLFSIGGTAISKNVFIGPTPNLQTAMMHEVRPMQFAHYFPIVFNAPPEQVYRSYFPENWQSWPGLMEAYHAGKMGRSEIIAHGSTIDPEWFAGKPFYPLSPTLGCMSGLELWNKKTGKIDRSDQLDLVNTFIESPGTIGYMMVINLDNKAAPVSTEEIEQIVAQYETGQNIQN